MSFARGWGKDGWKHRQEDMMRNTWDIFRITNRTRIRKSKTTPKEKNGILSPSAR